MSNDGLLARRDSRRMHPAVRQIAAEAAGEDPGPAVRRKSIDQVLTSVMDKKDKESIFDSPKLLNKHQRALSKGNTLTFQVGNYRIGSTIGKGRYSVVKLATHVLTNEFVALKIVSKAKLSREDVRVLQREMQIMKLLDHPNIVKLYEVIDTTDFFYLVLEYVDGRTLTEKLPDIFKLKRKKREDMARKIFAQLASAVSYCHHHAVVHRDIKTDNLLVLEDATVKLADWGFSNLAEGLLNTHCGTPYYASPELFRPQAYNGPPSDVWAMGVLLYYMYVGKLPFREDPIREYIKTANFKMPKDAPSELKSLLSGMLRVNPEKRYLASEVCVHRWVTGSSPAPANSSSASEPGPATLTRAASCGDLANPRHGDVVELMVCLGFTEEEIQHSLESRLYDQVAATYYLLRDSPKLHMYRLHVLSAAHTDAGTGSPAPSSPSTPKGDGTPRRSRAHSASKVFNFLLFGSHAASKRRSSAATSSLPGSPAPRNSSASSSPAIRPAPSPT